MNLEPNSVTLASAEGDATRPAVTTVEKIAAAKPVHGKDLVSRQELKRESLRRPKTLRGERRTAQSGGLVNNRSRAHTSPCTRANIAERAIMVSNQSRTFSECRNGNELIELPVPALCVRTEEAQKPA